MAKASIVLVCKECGETFRHERICRNRSDATDYEEWAEKNITQCPECFKKEQREIKRQKELKALEGIELAELTGSEKQVKWAEDIRRKAVADCIEHDPKEIFWTLVNAHTEAKWWIENRYQLSYREIAATLRKGDLK